MEKKELTKAEEQVMHYLWKLGKGFLKDVVEQFPDPKPAYTTVSTVVRVLVRKNFVGYESYGKVHQYHPKVTKKEYFKSRLAPIITNYFEGSTSRLTSHFANEEMNLTELEEIQKLVEERIAKLKKDEL